MHTTRSTPLAGSVVAVDVAEAAGVRLEILTGRDKGAERAARLAAAAAHEPVVGSATAIFLFALSLWAGDWLFWIATGVTAYGALYFMAHDGLVHHRWPFKSWKPAKIPSRRVSPVTALPSSR